MGLCAYLNCIAVNRGFQVYIERRCRGEKFFAPITTNALLVDPSEHFIYLQPKNRSSDTAGTTSPRNAPEQDCVTDAGVASFSALRHLLPPAGIAAQLMCRGQSGSQSLQTARQALEDMMAVGLRGGLVSDFRPEDEQLLGKARANLAGALGKLAQDPAFRDGLIMEAKKVPARHNQGAQDVRLYQGMLTAADAVQGGSKLQDGPKLSDAEAAFALGSSLTVGGFRKNQALGDGFIALLSTVGKPDQVAARVSNLMTTTLNLDGITDFTKGYHGQTVSTMVGSVLGGVSAVGTRVLTNAVSNIPGVAAQLRGMGVPDWNIALNRGTPGTLYCNPIPFRLDRLSPTGNPILARLEYGTLIDRLIEAAKPSAAGKRVMTHSYENPGTHDPTGGRLKYDDTKSVLPKDHVELFKQSKPVVDEKGKIVRYTLDKDGNVHRFQETLPGIYHWNSSTNGMTKSGQPRRLKVPPDVWKMLNGK